MQIRGDENREIREIREKNTNTKCGLTTERNAEYTEGMQIRGDENREIRDANTGIGTAKYAKYARKNTDAKECEGKCTSAIARKL